MADRVQLRAETRQMLGKKVRRLRHAGILPATVYGQKTKPQSIQIHSHELRGALKQAGRTVLIDLLIDNQAARPVLIRQTAVDPKRNQLIHIEFFQPNLREKMSSHVPLHFVGESPAVKEGGIFLPVLDHVDIESLPGDVPEGGIEVDVSQIQEINGLIHAGDLNLGDDVALLTPPDEVVAKVNPPVGEAVVEEAVAATEPLPAELGGDEQPADSVPES